MKTSLRVLHLEDDLHDAELVREELIAGGFACEVVVVQTEADFRTALEQGGLDLILLDYKLPSFDGLSALALAPERRPGVPVIMVSGSLGDDVAVETLKRGATDYVLKDRLSRLVPVVQRALREAEERAQRRRAEQEIRLLQTITQAMGEAPDSNSALAVALKRVCEAIGWSFGEAWIPRPDASALELSPAWYGRSKDTEELRNLSAEISFPPGVGLPGRVWVSRQPEWIPDVSVNEHIFLRAEAALTSGLKAGLGVPIVSDGQVLAVLGFFTSETREENQRLVKTISAVAAQLGSLLHRKRIDEALSGSERKYRTLVSEINDGFFTMDTSGVFTLANKALAEIFGCKDPEELVDRSFVEFIAPELRDDIAKEFTKDMEAGKPPEVRRAPIVRKDGSIVFIEVKPVPVFEEGRLAGTRGVVRDITERERMEGELRQAQKMEAVGQLAAGVAHDFNNLLQAMLSHTQLLRAHSGERPELRAVADDLEGQIRRGAALTRQLLIFSRRETARPERIDLNEAVRGALQLLRRLVRENIAFATDLAGEQLPVVADRGQLEQVLMNLVVNASDAMPDGGRLVVRTGREGEEWVCFAVEDTGGGIPEELRGHIFEPFFTTKGAGVGTGLGLSVVHGIITQHGGRVELESKVGEGSTFRIVLPRAGSGEVRAVAEAAAAPEELARGHGERVLVVEDEEGAREGLKEILSVLGYRAVAVGSGTEAGSLPVEPAFDVLLTDLLLPDVSGDALAQGLRDRWAHLKVILMSGYTEDEALRRGINRGKVRFLQKPFDMATLAREISAALAER